MPPVFLRQDTPVARISAKSAASICQPLPGLFASCTAYQEELLAGHPWPHGTGDSCRCVVCCGLSNVVKNLRMSHTKTQLTVRQGARANGRCQQMSLMFDALAVAMMQVRNDIALHLT